MCGIAGVVNLDRQPASPVILRRMTDAIAHRGPDGEGSYIDGAIGLGHRRLAILDLSPAGHQPMQTADGRYVLVYNGEVYNFHELRVELEAIGYQFHSRTDSEVVLNAVAAWGTAALDRFNGMYAFAVWDRFEEELLLARDRYGIKPLYYCQIGAVLLFASEVKAILTHPAYSVELDKEALLEYFTFQNLFTERTFFRGVHLLPAGTYLRLALHRNAQARPVRYWDFSFVEPAHAADEREYIEEIRRLFTQAVNRQLVSDVTVGSYLSGGIDSGSVTAYAARQLPYLQTFTAGFDMRSASGIELTFDEREAAEYMSYLFRTEHYEMVLKAGDMERVMPKLAWHIEEPRVGQSYPNYYVAQLAGKFVKVVLSGVGSDEIFGGYPWRYYRAVINDDFEQYIDRYYDFWQRLIPNTVIHEVFSPIQSEVQNVWTRDIFRDVFASRPHKLSRPEDFINHSLYFEARTFLHGLLVVEDKLSMAHGLETRIPFLDNDVVDFAMKLPVRMKLGNLTEVVRLNENEPGPKAETYYRRVRDGKLILRKMLADFVPSSIADGAKKGFSAPDASWFKGESIEYIQRLLLDSTAHIYEYFSKPAVEKLIGEHLSGAVNRRLLIWSLLSFEWWCRTFAR